MGVQNKELSEAIWVSIEMESEACFGHGGLTASLIDDISKKNQFSNWSTGNV